MKCKGKSNSKTNALDTSVTLKKLGKRIKQLRINKGYTSYEYFAYDHNISRAQFGRYEQDRIYALAVLSKL